MKEYIFNPWGLNLRNCKLLHLRFGEHHDTKLDEDEVIDFMTEYNLLPGTKIIGFQMFFQHADDFANDLFTVRFYII